MNALIRLLYALLIAVAVVVFVGISIYSVYPGPKAPEYPNYGYNYSANEAEIQKQQADQQSQQKAFDESQKKYREKEKNYQQNVTIIAVILSVLIILGGLWYMRRNEIIGEGLALGGVGVSVYSVITASIADHRIMRLVAVTTLLLGSILLVHRRFIEEPPKKKSR